MRQKLNLISSWIYAQGKLILGLWALLFLGLTLYLLLSPRHLAETELSGAPHTEAAQVQNILIHDFSLKLGGTAAVVLPQHVSGEDLENVLTRALPEVQAVQKVETERPHRWQLYKIVFAPQDALTTLQQRTPQLRTVLKQWNPEARLTGSTAFQYDTRVESKKDARRSEGLAFLVSLGVLILTFGALSAACLPLVLGGSVLLFFHGLMAFLEAPLSPVSRILTSLVGLALSIDYALFMVSRFREERDQGASLKTAWQTTLYQTGQTVLFSGLIMLVSLSALLIPDVSLSRHLMLHLMLIILLSLVHALILLPLLLVYGDRWWHWPGFLSRWIKQQRQRNHGHWFRFSQHVVHHARTYFCL